MTGRHVEILEAAAAALRDAHVIADGVHAPDIRRRIDAVLRRIDRRLARPPEGRADLERAEIQAQRIARIIDDETPPGFGFILWLASEGRDGVCTYVASIQRDDAVRMLEEWIALQRGGGMPPTLDGVDKVAPECWTCGSKHELERIAGRHRSVVVCRRCRCKLGR